MNGITENQFGLFDFLIVIAENIRLLIIGPLVLGGLAFGVASYLPQSYVSHTLLVIPATSHASTRSVPSATSRSPGPVAPIVVSPRMLESVIAVLNLAETRSLEVAKLELLGQIKVSTNRDGLVSLAVTSNTPTKAQAIAEAVIDYWLKSLPPSEHERLLLEKRLMYATAALDSVNRAMARLMAEPAKMPSSGAGELAMGVAAMNDLSVRYLSDIQDIKRQLEVPSRDDVIMQAPSLPTQSVAPNKGMIALMVMLATGFVLLLWIFIRKAWRDAVNDSLVVDKLGRLRAVIGSR